jgi:hypothetical protein
MELDRYTHDGLTIRILYDEDCSSPRENDNLGTIIAWHRRYRLSDEDAPAIDSSDFNPADYAICLPIYMLDHSGIALSTGSFGDPWDSGQVGWIYVTREKMLKDAMAKRATRKVIENAMRVLKAEIEEYGQYVNGECYGFIVEDEDGKELDSCWGFIGDYVHEAAKDSANYLAAERTRKADELTDAQRSNN